ncbi:MAG TPA: hypothetical protein PKU97_21110, partial [Kofleriaceae bacterium]|nr:hypothetical protein [Kofleriaceae bacterium]
MTTLLVLLGLLVVAGVPYIAWTRLDARSHRRAAALHEDVLALGDEAFPPSIHPEIDLSECIGSGACVRACPEGEVLAITDGRARLVNPLAYTTLIFFTTGMGQTLLLTRHRGLSSSVNVFGHHRWRI